MPKDVADNMRRISITAAQSEAVKQVGMTFIMGTAEMRRLVENGFVVAQYGGYHLVYDGSCTTTATKADSVIIACQRQCPLRPYGVGGHMPDKYVSVQFDVRGSRGDAYIMYALKN